MLNRIIAGAALVLLVLTFGCGKNAKQTQVNKSEVESVGVQEYKTRTGKLFKVEIDRSMGASLNGLKVTTMGFTAVNNEHDFGTVDPLSKVFLADLDRNGYEELYIITQSVGSGSYSSIYGLASNKDKSATPIYVRPISEEQRAKGNFFEGYMGHNSFELKNGKLLNSFPIYKKDDPNASPSGGTRTVEYRLIAGEAGWILEAYKTID